jgi:hypothetical protein
MVDKYSHYSWLDLPLSQFLQMSYPGGLVMEVVALRDIQKGDELYLDYGSAWEAAWNEHVKNWQPPPDASSYVYPADINNSTGGMFRTAKEQENDPYPEHLATVCQAGKWYNRQRGKAYTWVQPEWPWPQGVAYCKILERTKVNNSYEYAVALEWREASYDQAHLLSTKELHMDVHVPASVISFVERPYKSDMNLPNAFRHPISLPQELVPAQWV